MEIGRPWHLEKSISVGHIITTVTVALGAIWWAAKLETRIDVLHTHFLAVQDRIEITDRKLETVRIESNAQLVMLKNDLQRQLDGMDKKLDTIMNQLIAHERSMRKTP